MSNSGIADLAFKALADSTRRSILELLQSDPEPVGRIAKNFPEMSRPAISKHLRILRESGLVSEEQQGRQRLYSLVAGSLDEALEWLTAARLATAAGAPVRPASGPVARLSPSERRPSVDWRVW